MFSNSRLTRLAGSQGETAHSRSNGDRRYRRAIMGFSLFALLTASIVTGDAVGTDSPAQAAVAVGVVTAESSTQAAVIIKKSSSYEIWLDKWETWAVGYTTWGGSYIAGNLPEPYRSFVKAYLWLMKSKAKSYVEQGRCMAIAFYRWGWWVNPVPAFTSYIGGNCR